MNITRGDKVILIKNHEKIKNGVGYAFEVGNITDTAIVIRNAVTKVAVAAIDIDDFHKYFISYPNTNVWTPWAEIVGCNGEIVGFYKTNRKRVLVKSTDYTGKVFVGKASCNKMDEFNLYIGIKVALFRCLKKIEQSRYNEEMAYLKKLEEEIKFIDSQIESFTKSVKPKES